MSHCPAVKAVFAGLALLIGAVHATPVTSVSVPAPVTALRLADKQSVIVDGLLDDPAWSMAEPLREFYEIDPGNGQPPPVQTEVRFARDARNLYIALRAWDPDLAALRAPFSRRDDIGSDEDHITVYLDPTGQRRFAQFFDINPRGVVTDGLYSEQTGQEDVAPNFRFVTRTARFEGGWTVELAIPFSSLRYADAVAPRWTVLVTRNYPRAQASTYMASGLLAREANCMLCYGRELMGLDMLPQQAPLSLTPTLTAQRQRLREDPAAAGAGTTAHRLGLDLKWRPRPALWIDATWRPDFSQVEIDAPQLSSNARYAIYFPERRPFFLEGGDILATPWPALQTRSIAAPEFGLRLTHRADSGDLVLLAARDTAVGDMLLPGAWRTDTVSKRQKSLVALARGRLNLGSLTLGGLLTRRHYERAGDSARDSSLSAVPPLGRNIVFGADASWNPTPEDRGDLQWLHSDSTSLQAERGVPRRGSARLARWSHKSERWNLSGQLSDASAGFRADNGFVEAAGLRKAEAELRHKQRDVGPFNEVALYGLADASRSHDVGTVSQSARLGTSVGLPLETAAWIAPLMLTQTRAASGGVLHRLQRLHAGLQSVPSAWLTQLRLEATLGQQLDVQRDRTGRGHQLALELRLRAGQQLQLNYRLDDLRIGGIGSPAPSGGSAPPMAERAQQVVALLHLGADHHLRLILQSRRARHNAPLGGAVPQSGEHDAAGSLSYQVQPADGMVLDAGISLRRTAQHPGGHRSRESDAFVKLSWTMDR